jgi:DNA-binding transcriptional regulator YiaG
MSSEMIIDSNEVPLLIYVGKGYQIRILRKSLDLTQEEFADILGVEKLTVARWETNERECKGPALVLINLLCKYDLWKIEISSG